MLTCSVLIFPAVTPFDAEVNPSLFNRLNLFRSASQVSRIREARPRQKHQNGGRPQRPDAQRDQDSAHPLPEGLQCEEGAEDLRAAGDVLNPTRVKVGLIRTRPDISTVILQRKGRGGDELKSFDETEMLTSELEENDPPNMDEEEKTSGETLGG